MSRTKSELRFIATATTIFALLVAGASPAMAAKPNSNGNGSSSSTASNSVAVGAADFLTTKFVDGKYLEGFTPGTVDNGFTLEALIQRKAAGQSTSKLATAVKYSLLTSTITGTSKSKTGYLYTADTKQIKVGLAGKWLFTSAVLNAKNSPLRADVLKALRAQITKKGLVASANASGMDYSWLMLGFATNTSVATSRLLMNQLIALQHADGGFGPDSNGDVNASGTDSTGLAIQALSAVKTGGSKSQNAAAKSAIAKAVAYLKANTSGDLKDHWEAWGGFDLNGSEYAIMGLSAAGQDTTLYTTWLKSQVASDKGISVPWATGVGDAYATAQGIIALAGGSYYSLINK